MIIFRCAFLVCLFVCFIFQWKVWQQLHVCLTWSELFDTTLAGTGVDRQEVFEPGDLWVRDAAGSTQHGGRPRPFHHLQLGTHVYTGEAEWQLVLWTDADERKVIRMCSTIQNSYWAIENGSFKQDSDADANITQMFSKCHLLIFSVWQSAAKAHGNVMMIFDESIGQTAVLTWRRCSWRVKREH